MVEQKPQLKYRPSVMIIIDGWGIAPDSPGNAIAHAKTPVMDRLIAQYPTTVLISSGDAVGLRWGEVGNSQVGHLNIGAGTVFYQNLLRINKIIADGSFYENKVLFRALEHIAKTKGKFHVMGILSSGGVHGHIDHFFAILEFCRRHKITDVYLHAFLDGRDAVYNSGKVFMQDALEHAKKLKIRLHICTISGRFYAMDRDNRWDRTSTTYQAIVYGKAPQVVEQDPVSYIESQYKHEVFDEQIPPTVFTDKGKPIAIVEDGDVLIFFNFRSDRARQITKAFAVPGFDKVEGKREFKDLFFATMVEYEKNLPVEVMYPPLIVTQPLAKVIADQGLTQYHIAETEKYAHVTFFLNGGIEEPFEGEDRKMIPSHKVKLYDEKPEMRAKEITDDVIQQIQSKKYDFIVINFANPDIIAHTGNLKATIKACEVVDTQIGRIIETVLAYDGLVVITADHGNAEELLNLQTGEMDKEHSTNPVPFILVAKDLEGRNLGLPEGVGRDLSVVQPSGILADVAPTVLELIGLPVPPEMTGTSLINRVD